MTQQLIEMIPSTRAVNLPPHNGLKVQRERHLSGFVILTIVLLALIPILSTLEVGHRTTRKLQDLATITLSRSVFAKLCAVIPTRLAASHKSLAPSLLTPRTILVGVLHLLLFRTSDDGHGGPCVGQGLAVGFSARRGLFVYCKVRRGVHSRPRGWTHADPPPHGDVTFRFIW